MTFDLWTNFGLATLYFLLSVVKAISGISDHFKKYMKPLITLSTITGPPCALEHHADTVLEPWTISIILLSPSGVSHS